MLSFLGLGWSSFCWSTPISSFLGEGGRVWMQEIYYLTPGFLNGSAVKNLPAMQATQERWVLSLGWEGPLQEKMAIHSSILACKIPWTEECGRLQSIGPQRVGHDRINSQTHRVRKAPLLPPGANLLVCMKWGRDPTVPPTHTHTHTHTHTLPSVCLCLWKYFGQKIFNQRSEKMWKQRKTV